MAQGNVFQEVSIEKPKYSWFDLSHDHKLTLNMGELIPILCCEALPGDKFILESEAMFRMQPMIAPIMHKVDIYIHHFFVPNRILWKNWENFISPPIHAGTNALPVVPTMHPTAMEFPKSSLADYLGFPLGDWGTDLGTEALCSAIPFVAYQRIWYDYYRDQNLETMESDSFDDWIQLHDGGNSLPTSLKLREKRRRAWEHDYFTSCLPFAQKGTPVSLPIEVTTTGTLPVQLTTSGGYATLKKVDGTALGLDGPLYSDGSTNPDSLSINLGGGSFEQLQLDPNHTLEATGAMDSTAVSTTINDLRAAYALQKWLEKNARGGTRYTETLLLHFGVRSSDSRLQRPEYLGGSRSIMAISEVLQTSGTADTPQGNMSGHGISMMGSNQVNYYCEEHGIIMSLLSIRPKTAYHQGVPRLFQKTDRFQYFWPDFALLGEEPVKNKELYYQKTIPNTNDDTFGYLPRYSEYRYLPSRVSGDFHETLEYWSLHRTFDSVPVLNGGFIGCKPSNRIFAVDPSIAGVDSIIAHVYHQIAARRPLPRYGSPGGLI